MRLVLVLVLVVGAVNPVRADEPDAKFNNPWPADWEREFQERAKRILKNQCDEQKATGLGGRTYFENEKRAYGYLMSHVVAGDRETALKELQKQDAQADSWHKHTLGIDYFACFTLKHQMRKYFYFGDQLDPAYKKRMFDGGKIWTEKDPLRRPHHSFMKETGGWGPDQKNSWVDVRNTENLFLMRVTSVYLMAEETGNKATTKLYKDLLLNYAKSLYRVGVGEWDSENYHGHSIAPLLNLYDFAKDPDVKLAAKACLDYCFAAGAVKYFHGAFNGPTKRDYNHPQPFGGSAASMLWVYFGDNPRDNHNFESDEIHAITSRYRPPVAVMHLARKNFERPVELLACKPNYNASTGNDYTSPPEQLETQYIGRTFQMGSLITGTPPKSDINGFKIVLADEKEGAFAIQCVPGADPLFPGSPRYEAGKVSAPNRVAQNRNTAIWLVESGESPWLWVVPKSVIVEQSREITFLRFKHTWIALHPININSPYLSVELINQLTAPDKDKKPSPWLNHQVLTSKGKGGKYCGFAVEIGEAPVFKDYATFRLAVIDRSRTDMSELANGIAGFNSAEGKSVKLKFGPETVVWRDGKLHDQLEHAKYLYHEVGRDKGLIEQSWLGGRLTVRAGETTFTCSVADDGRVEFDNK